MSTQSSDDLLGSLGRLTWRAASQPWKLAWRNAGALIAPIRGKADQSVLLDGARSFVANEPLRFARDLAGLSVDTAAAALDLGLRYQERLLDEVFGPAVVREATAELSAPLGAHLVHTLTITNEGSVPLPVTVTAEVFSAVEEPPMAAQVRPLVEGVTASVEPRQEVAVLVRIFVDPAVFEAGRSYVASLRVRGRGVQHLRLSLHVEGTAEGTAEATGEGAPALEVTSEE